MAHIDYYFATLSPYTYLAGTRFEEVAKKHGATVAYKPLDIMALFSRTGGTPPKDRHPNRVEYRAQELVRQGKKLNMPFNLKPAHWPTNAAPSSYAIIAAQNTGGGDLGALVHAILRAVWSEEKNIAEDDVVSASEDTVLSGNVLADNGNSADTDPDGDTLSVSLVPPQPVIIIDGSNDFPESSRFDATSSGPIVSFYAVADENGLNLAFENIDVDSGGPQHFGVAYIATGAVGTMQGLQINTQSPLLPFSASLALVYRADGVDTTHYQFDGMQWIDTGLVISASESGNFVELQIPNSQLNSADNFEIVSSFVFADPGFESTFHIVPDSAGVNGAYDPDFTSFLTIDAFDPSAGPDNGTLILNSDGSFTYTPDSDFFGEDSFT